MRLRQVDCLAGAGSRPLRRGLWAPFIGPIRLLAAWAALAAPAAPARGTAVDPSQDSLGLELVLPPSARQGAPVRITLRARNRSGRPLDLILRGRTATFDVTVAHRGGEVVWRRLEDSIIPAIVHVRTLAPAERLVIRASWDLRTRQRTPLGPGDYEARGLLLVEGEPLRTPPVAFRVVGP